LAIERLILQEERENNGWYYKVMKKDNGNEEVYGPWN
jgi:hypothetical protein